MTDIYHRRSAITKEKSFPAHEAAHIRPYARNAKAHGADVVAKIAAIMAEFGWTVPRLVAEDGELIAGHIRR